MSHQLYGKLGKPSQLVMLHCQEICAWQVTAQLCQRFVEQISHQRDTALSECSSLTCEMRAEKVQGSPILVKVGVNFHIYIYINGTKSTDRPDQCIVCKVSSKRPQRTSRRPRVCRFMVLQFKLLWSRAEFVMCQQGNRFLEGEAASYYSTARSSSGMSAFRPLRVL